MAPHQNFTHFQMVKWITWIDSAIGLAPTESAHVMRQFEAHSWMSSGAAKDVIGAAK